MNFVELGQSTDDVLKVLLASNPAALEALALLRPSLALFAEIVQRLAAGEQVPDLIAIKSADLQGWAAEAAGEK